MWIIESPHVHTCAYAQILYWYCHKYFSGRQHKKLNDGYPGGRRGGGVGGGTSLSEDASGIHLQMQRISQSASWEWAGVPDHPKGVYRSTQNSVFPVDVEAWDDMGLAQQHTCTTWESRGIFPMVGDPLTLERSSRSMLFPSVWKANPQI